MVPARRLLVLGRGYFCVEIACSPVCVGFLQALWNVQKCALRTIRGSKLPIGVGEIVDCVCLCVL